MPLSLLCTPLHPNCPGVTIALDRTPAGGLTLTVPGTTSVLHHLVQLIRDGALVLTGPNDPVLAEMERQIMADRDRLLARADALLAARPHPTRQAG